MQTCDLLNPTINANNNKKKYYLSHEMLCNQWRWLVLFEATGTIIYCRWHVQKHRNFLYLLWYFFYLAKIASGNPFEEVLERKWRSMKAVRPIYEA